MNRLAAFLSIFVAPAFLLLGPRQSFGQTQLGSERVAVPSPFRTSPFDRDRYLQVPRGFQIQVVARIPAARFLRSTPEGGLLVSQPSRGKIWWISGTPANVASPILAASGLRLPHGMAFIVIAGKAYVFVSESNEISRFQYDPNHHTLLHKEVIVPNLPDTSSAELRSSYRHELKNLAISPDRHLYVDIASSTNADPTDTTSDPIRCAIYRYDLDGGNRTLFAGYIDDHPPDTFIHVRSGADYGWPFAEPNPDSPSGLDDMPLDPYYDNNPDWSKYPESRFTRSDKGIQAHSAPLGMAFLQETKLPEWLRNSATVAYHGSWDRTRKTGYKVVIFPWTSQQRPGNQVDLVTGWLDEQSQRVWGRPVDVKPSTDGKSLFISDDDSGTVYELRPGE